MANIGNYGEVAKSSLLHCNVTGTSVEPHLDITVEAMSSCLVNTAHLTTNADRQLLIAFVSSSYLYEISRISNKIDNFM